MVLLCGFSCLAVTTMNFIRNSITEIFSPEFLENMSLFGSRGKYCSGARNDIV